MNMSRCCRGSAVGKSTSMDQEALENLLAKQKVARWIEEVVEHLLRRNLETSMDRDCDKIYRDKKKESLDRRKYVKDLLRSCRA